MNKLEINIWIFGPPGIGRKHPKELLSIESSKTSETFSVQSLEKETKQVFTKGMGLNIGIKFEKKHYFEFPGHQEAVFRIKKIEFPTKFPLRSETFQLRPSRCKPKL